MSRSRSAVRATAAASVLSLFAFSFRGAAMASAIDAGWKIVSPSHPDPAVRMVLETAAKEIQSDIEEACGLRLPLVPAAEAPSSHAFFIGKDAAQAAGLDVSGLSSWANVYAEKNGSIYLFGDDHPGRSGLRADERDLRFTVYPSARAAARFLRDLCGVRFLMPGRLGTEVPAAKEISIPDGTLSLERPTQKFGSYTTRTGSLMFATANCYFPCGDLYSYGGHTYPTACPWDKYGDEHPEYFALRGGERRKASRAPFQALCISNPAVEDLVVAELERRFDAGASICQLAQQDALDTCECENCRAMFGTGDDWGEKYWCFHRRIAERILKERPGKTVHILSYSQTRHPPKTFKDFPANVMIELCKNGESDFAEWKGYTVPQGFSVYIYHWMAYDLAGYTPRRSLYECHASARRYVANGSAGVYRCGDNLGLCALEGPQYYVFNRTLEDPDASIAATLREFCRAAYGDEAAGPAISFYEALDKGLRGRDRDHISLPDVPGSDFSRYGRAEPDFPLDVIAATFTPETLGAMEGALAYASKSATATPRQKARLARLAAEFEYTRNLARIAMHYRAYCTNPCKANFLPLAEELLARKRLIDGYYANGSEIRLDGWPEDAVLLGRDGQRSMVEVNGRSGAVIISPLDWDVERMLREEDYPWTAENEAKWRRYNKEKGLVPAKDWKTFGETGPAVSERSRDGARLRFGTTDAEGVSAVAHVAPEGGLKPNTRYRVSCFVRADYIAPVWGTRYGQERGLFLLVDWCGGRGIQNPPRASFRGSFGWRRLAFEFETPEKPLKSADVKAWLCNSNGVVEVDELVIEEL